MVEKIVWWTNRIRQRFHRSRTGRFATFTLNNLMLGYFMSVFANNRISLFPSNIEEFILLVNAPGFLGLLVTSVLCLFVFVFVPIDDDLVLQAVDEAAAKKIPELIQGAKSVDKVIADMEKIKQSRKK